MTSSQRPEKPIIVFTQNHSEEPDAVLEDIPDFHVALEEAAGDGETLMPSATMELPAEETVCDHSN